MDQGLCLISSSTSHGAQILPNINTKGTGKTGTGTEKKTRVLTVCLRLVEKTDKHLVDQRTNPAYCTRPPPVLPTTRTAVQTTKTTRSRRVITPPTSCIPKELRRIRESNLPTGPPHCGPPIPHLENLLLQSLSRAWASYFRMHEFRG